MSMFCYQCQEAAKGVGCSVKGVCGKTSDVANLQDLLLYTSKGVAVLGQLADAKGVDGAKANKYIIDSLFITITNANFDAKKIIAKIKDGYAIQDELKAQIDVPADIHDCAVYRATDENAMESKALLIGILSIENEDIRSLKELLTYGLRYGCLW